MFSNITIKSRLIFIVGFLSLMCVTGAFIGLGSLYLANEGLRENYEHRLVPISKLDRIVRLIDRNQIAIAQAVSAEPGTIADELDGVEKRIQQISALWEDYERVQGPHMSADEKALLEATVAKRRKFVADGVQPALVALRAADVDRANAVMRGQMNALAAQVSDSVSKLVEYHEQRAQQEYAANQQIYRWVRNSCLSGMLLSVLLGVVICVWLVRSIARPLQDAVEVARSVAAGDLTRAIRINSGDETGQLLQALRDMNHSLVKIVSEVRHGTETITSAAGQIASGNLDLSARTETQASSLEETASSMEELTSTVQQNAHSAVEANRLAVSASEVAVQGGSIVAQVVDTMGSINASSRKIVDIIDVIDSIAFQTNILALNAAVEAARAGEQGKGFAVVASEVRQLAQRSATAAKQIKELIDDSVRQVENGAALVDRAGATMQDIVSSVKRVTDIMSEISVASREQTEGIQQVNQAISQMDGVTQQNAALVEEAAAAAQSLQEQAVHLAQVVGIFKLDAATAAPDARAGTLARLPAPG